jgi:hypothetical protein
MAPKPDATIKIPLRVPESLLAQYEARATLQKKDVADLLVERLRQCVMHIDSQPIYLSDSERDVLSQLASKRIANATELIAWARSLTSINVGGVSVPLSEQLQKRLETRKFGKSWPELMKSMVTDGLETAVGMR